jgi:hypothetical protein
MTPRLFVALGLRLLGIFWVLYLLGHMYGLSIYLNHSATPVSRYVIWGATILQLLICLALWVFPSTIAGKLLPSAARADEDPPPPRLADWQALGVACVGLWSLAAAIPRTVFWLNILILNNIKYPDYAYMDLERRADFAATVAQLLISLWLVFGSRSIARVIFKLRNAGVAKQDAAG